MDKKPSLVFDLDGTILDVSKRYYEVYKKTVENPLPFGEYWSKKRNRTYHELPSVLPLIEQPQFLALDTVYPGMKNVLGKLSKQFLLILVTLRKQRMNLFSQLGALGLFSIFADHQIHTPGTPTEKIRIIGERKPQAVIGDTELDIQAAKSAGATSIAVTWGIRNRQFLNAQKPDILLANSSQLIEIIKKHEVQSHHRHPRVQ